MILCRTHAHIYHIMIYDHIYIRENLSFFPIWGSTHLQPVTFGRWWPCHHVGCERLKPGDSRSISSVVNGDWSHSKFCKVGVKSIVDDHIYIYITMLDNNRFYPPNNGGHLGWNNKNVSTTEGQQLTCRAVVKGEYGLSGCPIGVNELAREIFNNRFMKIISIWKSASHDETTKRPSHAGGKPMSFDRSFSSRFPSEELVWIAPLWDLSRETSLRKSSRIIGKYSFWLNSTWRFPKIGVPLVIIHFRLGFSITNQPAIGVPPWLWKPYLKLPFSSWISHSFPICSQGFLGDCHVTSPLESGSRHSKRWKLILEVCRRKSTDITRANGRPDGRLTNHLCCTYIYIYIFYIYICVYLFIHLYLYLYLI